MREGLPLETLRGIYAGIAGRYDLQHAIVTFRSDQRGRKLVVSETVAPGDNVLDCGAGTGATALLAARRAGPSGHVTLFDLSEEMLGVAERKLSAEGLAGRFDVVTGDMTRLPFPDGSFDCVVSTYSLCPLYDPSQGALEMLRVVRPGGRIGAAHSTERSNRLVKAIADGVESVAWRLQWLSMGCRAVHVLPAFEEAGTRVLLQRSIGVPLWPFVVIVVEKPP